MALFSPGVCPQPSSSCLFSRGDPADHTLLLEECPPLALGPHSPGSSILLAAPPPGQACGCWSVWSSALLAPGSSLHTPAQSDLTQSPGFKTCRKTDPSPVPVVTLKAGRSGLTPQTAFSLGCRKAPPTHAAKKWIPAFHLHLLSLSLYMVLCTFQLSRPKTREVPSTSVFLPHPSLLGCLWLSLHNVSGIGLFLTSSTAAILVPATFFSHLDYSLGLLLPPIHPCLCAIHSPPSHERAFLNTKSDSLTLLLQASSRLPSAGAREGPGDGPPCPPACLLCVCSTPGTPAFLLALGHTGASLLRALVHVGAQYLDHLKPRCPRDPLVTFSKWRFIRHVVPLPFPNSLSHFIFLPRLSHELPCVSTLPHLQ